MVMIGQYVVLVLDHTDDDTGANVMAIVCSRNYQPTNWVLYMNIHYLEH